MKKEYTIEKIVPTMHTINLNGGIGNQLFMVFTVLAYGIQHKRPFYFEEAPLKLGWRKRQYWDTIFKNLERFKRPIETNKLYKEPAFHYVPIPYFPPAMHFKFDGYFQSYLYFHSYVNEIFQIMELDQMRKEVQSTVDEFTTRDWSTTVSLHFRIGDYKKIQDYHNILSKSYYYNALQSLITDTQKNDWTILVYGETEDESYIKSTVQDLKFAFPTLQFTYMKDPIDDWQEMLSMSLCRHHIIANSSFSYFGAYFNRATHLKYDDPNKAWVYYPDQWVGPKLKKNETGVMCLDTWNRIPC